MPQPTWALNRAELARIMRHVTITDDCWTWTGPTTPNGYAKWRAKPGGREKVVHRTLWAYHQGSEVPEGMQLDHTCHTRVVERDGECVGCKHRLCCNPDHLELVTPSENTMRQDHANRKRTECPRGHPYDDANTRVDASGRRHCRTCDQSRRR